MTDPYDLAVIGGGPGGYVAAIRAAQLGMSVACIDKRATLGGTCLNVGCIPSKALLQSSEIYERTAGHLAEHGVAADNVRLDLAAMMARKDKVVGDLTKGIGFLFKKNKVDWLTGQARFAAADRLTVSLNEGGEREIVARKVLIATGSASMDLPGVTVDEDRIVSSTGALAFPEVPEHLVVVGAGVIGLELGSVWHRLGARVTVVEYLDRIVPTLDSEIAKMFQRLLARQGLSFRLGSKVTGASIAGDKVTLSVEAAAGGGGESLEADRVLVAIGRRPYTEGLGLDVIGAAVDERGFIKVDDHFRTTVENVHAIGDVIPGPMLAHKAEEDGVAAVEIMAGQAGHVDYDRVPNVIYTHPEVAAVGMTEDQAREKGLAVKIGKFPFSANSRARCNGDSDGVVKIIADAETDRILGAHIVGPDAGTLIAELVGVMEFGASAEDVARTCHAHPSLNEAVREAALAVAGRAIHV